MPAAASSGVELKTDSDNDNMRAHTDCVCLVSKPVNCTERASLRLSA